MHSFTYILLAAASVVNAATFKVQVGMNSTGGLATTYTPNQVTAQPGDIIEFEFRGKNHTVTQSSFAEPCTQQFNTATNLAGVDSGFMPVAANATEIPVFSIQVNDASSPQWFFCNQANHCNSGMLFAINAPATGAKTFAAYAANAANATHPDPALHQTAPFTPAPAAAASSSSDPLASDPTAAIPTGTDSVDPNASVTSSVLGATDVPANAAPNVSTTGGLSLSVGSGTSAADNSGATGTTKSAGSRIESSVGVAIGLAGVVMSLML